LINHDANQTNYRYIKNELQNPMAARQLFEEMNKAIASRLSSPLAFEPYYSKKERQHFYYRIRIKNYVIYYVVIDDVMELRRFVYSGRKY
jgi:mRNA-degrading endonuclease RelE of RelBE toxin-antitoxin system